MTGQPGHAREPVASDDVVVRLRDVGKTYRTRGTGLSGRSRDVAALDGVSLDVHRGEIVAVVGETGSGKTTLGRVVAGLVTADRGQVDVAGPVQMVYQDPSRSLNPRMQVGRSLAEALPGGSIGLRRRLRAERARIVDALREVGLEEQHVTRRPGNLSGGQQQRVAIARALLSPARIVVLDEATSALDWSVRSAILELLAQVRAANPDYAFLFITHDLALVRGLADQVLVLYAGKAVERGPAATVLSTPAHPYTRMLLEAELKADEYRPLDERDLPERLRPLSSADTMGCVFAGRCASAFDACAVEPSERPVADDAAHRAACHLLDDPHTTTAEGRQPEAPGTANP